MGGQPDLAMLAAATRVAGFIESGGASSLAGVFADRDVTIIENFAPYVFDGADAVETWADAMRGHLVHATGLRHTFAPAHDFSRTGDTAYFAVPTTWRGESGGRPFVETGGWAFVLTLQDGEWRVRAYGWAVTSLSAQPATPSQGN
jgi:hypothetical protein